MKSKVAIEPRRWKILINARGEVCPVQLESTKVIEGVQEVEVIEYGYAASLKYRLEDAEAELSYVIKENYSG